MSKVFNPGPRTIPLPQLPKVKFAGAENTLLSYHWIPGPAGSFHAVALSSTFGCELQLSRVAKAFVLDGSDQLLAVSAKPECNDRIPLTSQFPTTPFTTLFRFLPYFRPCPRGSWYTA